MRPHALCVVAPVLLSALTLHPTAAQPTEPSPAPEPIAPARADADRLRLASTLELARLLDLCAARLGVTIDYDPANPLIRGQSVTIRAGSDQGLTSDQVWTLLGTLLPQRGLAAIAQPGQADPAAPAHAPEGPAGVGGAPHRTARGLTIVKAEDAPRLARTEPAVAPADGKSQGADPLPPGATFRNLPVVLRHVSAKEASEGLRAAGLLRTAATTAGAGAVGAGSAPAGGVQPPGAEVLLLSDHTPRLAEQLRALAQIDTPGNATVIEPVTVANVTPAQVAAAVMLLAAKRESVSGEKLAGEVIAGAGGTGSPPATAPGGAASPPAPTAGGSVLVVAPRRAVPRWRELIAAVDQREPVTMQTYSPALFSVRDVATLVQQVAAAGGPGAQGGSGGGGADDRLRVIAEEPTGTLLVTATAAQHERIAELMSRLDAVPGEARRPMRSVVVRNRPVSEFVGTLSRLVAAGVLDGAGEPAAAALPGGTRASGAALTPFLPGSVAAPATAAARARPGSPGGPLAVTLTADEPTNTIIAVGDGRLLDQLETLIRTLDVRQPQVMLEAVLVSLSQDETLSLGVELEKLAVNGSTRIRLASLFGITPAGAAGNALLGPSGPPGGSALVIDPGDYSVAINALATMRSGRTATLPRVLVSNNQRAVFNALDQRPYTAAFTAGNASTPTTTFGGTQDAGTQLSIRPQIGDAGGLLLEYSISISQFGRDGGSSSLPPPRQVTSVQSVATIPDGHAVVVGGLEITSEGNEVRQVPLLGDIPVLGEAFKTRSPSTSRSRFFVFIRASIMRDAALDSLRHASDQAGQAAGLPPDWPTSTPQVIR